MYPNFEFAIERDMQGNVQAIITTPVCLRCYHVWWFTDFDWILGVPKDPEWCPCCISPRWRDPFPAGNEPKPTEEGVIRAYSPKFDVEFWSRQSWLTKQAKIRKTNKNLFLPVPVELKEQAKNELAFALKQAKETRELIQSAHR